MNEWKINLKAEKELVVLLKYERYGDKRCTWL
jgi:hypothetical protein